MTDVSAGFWLPCWCPSRWAPAWQLHTNLYKFGKNISPHIFRKKNCCDLNLGKSLCISTFFLFPDSRLNRLNGFYFLFWSILNGMTLKTSNTITLNMPVPIYAPWWREPLWEWNVLPYNTTQWSSPGFEPSRLSLESGTVIIRPPHHIMMTELTILCDLESTVMSYSSPWNHICDEYH